MICTILGGAGFIGSHLAEYLLSKGHKVRVFDRPGSENLNIRQILDDIEFVAGDFENHVSCIPSLKNADVVYHLISSTLPENSNWDPDYDVRSNVSGTIRILDECVRQKVGKVVFMSSGGAVYGMPAKIPIDEIHPTNPICSYGISKLTIEKYLQLYNHLYNLDYAVLRTSNAYGPRQNLKNAQGVIAAWLHNAANGRDVEIWGDGKVIRDYVYEGDVVRALTMAGSVQTKQKLFNVGSGKGISLNQLAEIIRKELNVSLTVRYKSGRKCDVPVSILDTSLIKKELGWEPLTNLVKGITLTMQWVEEAIGKKRLHASTTAPAM
jgi:UDP-glucose 4-epimerase